MKSLLVSIAFLFAITTTNVAQLNSFFDQTDAFLKKHVQNGKVNYKNAKSDAQLAHLIDQIATQDLNRESAENKQAFYINAYNLLVINGGANAYPLASVLDVSGFFDSKKHTVAGKKMTLNDLEKKELLKTYEDARFHFVLVCGAIGCPPITDFAYRPAQLEQQLAQQTRLALNDPNFIIVNTAQSQVELSQIFNWYSSDFGGSKASAIEFINKYRTSKIPADYKVSFYEYDWTLNEFTASTSSLPIEEEAGGNSANRYVVSAAIPKNTVELKIFNNLYSQRTGTEEELTDRSSFFTTFVSALYGVNNRFNAGFDLRYRRVSNSRLPESPFAVLGSPTDAQNRQGITTIGPKIRWAPTAKLPNFSIQSQFWIPLADDLAGTDTQPYIDWNGSTWWTQFFNDFTLNDRFTLFTEIDFLLEDIGELNRASTPATLILSYFPNPKTTIYALGGYSPRWEGSEFDYFAQAGLGAKYQFTPDVELELLYTGFFSTDLTQDHGDAATFNLGLRFSLF